MQRPPRSLPAWSVKPWEDWGGDMKALFQYMKGYHVEEGTNFLPAASESRTKLQTEKRFQMDIGEKSYW